MRPLIAAKISKFASFYFLVDPEHAIFIAFILISLFGYPHRNYPSESSLRAKVNPRREVSLITRPTVSRGKIFCADLSPISLLREPRFANSTLSHCMPYRLGDANSETRGDVVSGGHDARDPFACGY